MKKVRVNGRALCKYDVAVLIDRIHYSWAVVMYDHTTYDELRDMLRRVVAKFPKAAAKFNIENL